MTDHKFQVGDLVEVRQSYGHVCFDEVAKVTPSGKFRLKGFPSKLYNANGLESGPDRHKNRVVYLTAETKAEREQALARALACIQLSYRADSVGRRIHVQRGSFTEAQYLQLVAAVETIEAIVNG